MAGLNDPEGSIAALDPGDSLTGGGRASRGRERGGPGSGPGGDGGKGREVQVSKALSRLLRHQAQTAKITLYEKGYAELDKVVS